MMSRWSNGRMKHVVHRVPNPSPGRDRLGRISLMAFVLPDYDAVVECIHCPKDGSQPLYEKTWVGEMMNWGSKLPIYNQTKMELMRKAQGLYTNLGAQTKLGDPTDVKALEASMAREAHPEAKAIQIVDVALLVNGSAAEQLQKAKELSAAFESTGFAVITGHGVPEEVVNDIRSSAYKFFRQQDKGKGYGFGGYVNQQENGAQLLGDFSRPNDAVESLTAGLAGLAGGVEALQMEKVRKEDSEGSRVCHVKDLSGCEMEEGTPEVVSRPATEFLRGCERVSRLVATALKLSLGATEEEVDMVMTPSGGGLRLAYYPSVHPEAAAEDLMGYGSHIDSGGVTVIALDPANKRGLQVDVSDRVGSTGKEEDRHWVDVPFVPNTFVLNVGFGAQSPCKSKPASRAPLHHHGCFVTQDRRTTLRGLRRDEAHASARAGARVSDHQGGPSSAGVPRRARPEFTGGSGSGERENPRASNLNGRPEPPLPWHRQGHLVLSDFSCFGPPFKLLGHKPIDS
eukprot:s255_g2.t2